MTFDRHDVYTVCFSIAMTFFFYRLDVYTACFGIIILHLLIGLFFIPFATVSINMPVKRLVICAISMIKVYDVS